MDDISPNCFMRDDVYYLIAINPALDIYGSSFGGITKRGF